MAVTHINMLWKGRGGDIDELYARTQTVTYQVRTDDQSDGIETVLAALAVAGIAVGQPYIGHDGENLPGSYVKRISPQNDEEEPQRWEVAVEYGTVTIQDNKQDRRQPNQRNPDPLSRGQVISWGVEKYRKVVEFDAVTGEPLVNSAGDKFDPPYEKDQTRQTLTIEQNQAAFNAAAMAGYHDTVNEDVFFGNAAGTVKCDGISAQSQYENNTAFYKVRYAFHIHNEGWLAKILDQGFQELVDDPNPIDADDLVRQKILDPISAEPFSSPQPLNGAGRPLAKAKSPLDGNINAAQLTLAVEDGTVFPDPDPLDSYTWIVVKVDDEKMLISDRAGVTLTIAQRGYGGTAAAAHLDGVGVYMQHYFRVFEVYETRVFATLGLE